MTRHKTIFGPQINVLVVYNLKFISWKARHFSHTLIFVTYFKCKESETSKKEKGRLISKRRVLIYCDMMQRGKKN